MKRQGTVVRSAAVAMVATVTALWAGLVPLTTTAQVGVTVTIAQPADAITMDPQKHAVAFTDNVLVNVFEPLIRKDPYSTDPDKALQPWLAESWREFGPKRWQIKLRKGIKFHDGEELTAAVVKFSFERLINPDTKSPAASLFGTLDHVEIVDKYTINFVNKAPDPIWPARLAGDLDFVVPKTYVQDKGDATFAQHPVGTGPYRFVEWRKGEQVVLDANPDYWRGAPKQIRRLVFKPIPDAATRVAALQSGAVDIINELPVALLATLERDPRVYVTSAEGSNGLFFIGADMRFGGPLANKKVRQALNYAVNVDSIMKNVMQGQAVRTPTLVGPFTWGYAALKPYPYDPDKAKQLLTEAGFAGGFDVTFNASPTRWSEGKEIVEATTADLNKVGVRAKLKYQEWATYVDMLWSNKPHDLYIRTWSTGDKLDADTPMFLILRSGVASSTYSNPEVDTLLDAERRELRPDVRKKLFGQIQERIMEDPPAVFLFAGNAIYGVNRRLRWKAPHDYRMWLTDLTVVGR
jgi:peptide/nickel transport system substrate-binding protein